MAKQHQMIKTKRSKPKRQRRGGFDQPANVQSLSSPYRRNRQLGLNTGNSVPRYILNSGDVFTLHVKGSLELNNLVINKCAHLIALKPGAIVTVDYWGLGNVTPMLDSLRNAYSRFMVTGLRVGVQMITPATGGGYAIVNYEPTDSTKASPPTTIADVSNAVHTVTVSPASDPQFMELNPADYYADWRLTFTEADAEDAIKEAGVLQVYSVNSSAIAITALLVTLEYDIHFSGFKNSP